MFSRGDTEMHVNTLTSKGVKTAHLAFIKPTIEINDSLQYKGAMLHSAEIFSFHCPPEKEQIKVNNNILFLFLG